MLIAAATSAARARRSAPVLRRKHDRFEPRLPKRRGAGLITTNALRRPRRTRRTLRVFVAHEGLALPDEHQREVRQRRQVAARANRSTRRHVRVNAAVQRVDEPLQRLEPDAREPLRQHVRPQRHRRADDGHGERIADAGGVAAEQVHLQRPERVWRDADFRELAEAGVDAVGRLVALREAVDDGPRRAHALARGISQSDRLAVVRDGNEVIQRQGSPI